MADLSKIRIPNGTEYNLKDAQARADIDSLNGSLQELQTTVLDGVTSVKSLGPFSNCKLYPVDGTLQEATNRVATADIFVPPYDITLNCEEGFRYFLIMFTDGTRSGISGWQTGTYKIYEGQQYKLMIARVAEVTETADIDEFTSAITYKTNVTEKLTNIETKVYKEFTPTSYSGGIKYDTGVVNFLTGTLFYCVELDATSVTVNANTFTYYGYALYDKNKTLISAARVTADGEITIDTSEAKYLRLTHNTGTDTTIKHCGIVKDSFPVFSGEQIDRVLNEMLTNAANGDIIRIPRGNYNVANSIILKSDVSIIGESVFDTILTALNKNENNSSFILSVFYRVESERNTPLNNIRISDMTIDRANTETYNVGSKAFYAQNCTNSVFENLRIYNTPGTGFGIDYLKNVVIKNVYCYNCGRGWESIGKGCSGIGIGTGFYDDESFIITDCICENCGQAGIFLEVQPESSGAYCIGENQVIANNICKNSQYGILMTKGRGVAVVGNVINGCDKGITFRAKPERVVCSGNNISKCQTGVTTEGTRTAADGTVLFTSNILAENDVAISIDPVAMAMTGNFIADSKTNDIVLMGDFKNKFVAKGNVQTGTNDTSGATNFTIE